MDNQALQNAIRNMDRRKASDEVHNAAKSALDAAGSVGVDTPNVVLKDIRRHISDMTDVLQELSANQVASEHRTDERHKELIATLQQLGLQGSHMPTIPTIGAYRRPSSRASFASTSTEQQVRVFYDRNETVKTGSQIVAVILMHIAKIVKDSGKLYDSGDIDVAVMGVKDWSSAVTLVSSSSSTITPNKDKLILPRPSGPETSMALEIVCSTEMGIRATVRIEELDTLLNTCPGIMGIVEEVRKRLIKCPGIIPEGKRRQLSALKFPYTTRDKELSVYDSHEAERQYLKSSPIVIESVPKLKHKEKEAYVLMVLKDGIRPIVAYNSSH